MREKNMKTIIIEQVTNGWIVNVKHINVEIMVDSEREIHVFHDTKAVMIFVKAYLEV